jgi:DNA helicase II / ATP-dependent DNA helicase PcrA
MASNSENHEHIGQALLLLNLGLRPFIDREMSRVHGERWQELAHSDPHRRQPPLNWDTQKLLAVLWEQWNGVFATTLGRTERSLVGELRDTRNKWAHQEPFSADDTHRALDTIERLLRAISAPQAQELELRKERLLRARFASAAQARQDDEPKSTNDLPHAKPAQTLESHTTHLNSRYQLRQRFGKTANVGSPEEDALNPEQQQAVEHSGSHLLIVAGAGTGKTKTLTSRTAMLLKSIPAEHIAVMSFTIKAAQELYERLCRLTRSSDISQLWIGTFHSICRRILSENATALGYKMRFGVLDADDSRDVFRRCVPQGQFLDVMRVYQMYSLSRNSIVPWRTLLGRFSPAAREETVAETLRRYHLRMRRANRMDFDDLLTNTVYLLERHPEIRERYQRGFRQILVDEYQDTSRAQGRILELLACDGNITVVGDDSQAIYGFRGATVENILQFENGFQGAATVQLERNYRCTPEILSVANQSIANNKKRRPKGLFATTPHGRKPALIRAGDQTTEANFVADEILARYRAGLKLRNIAVLFRSAFCVRAVEDVLRSRGMPYALFGATPFFSQPHIKDLLAWFALVADPQDTFSLGRVWRQQPGLTDELLGRVEADADKDDKPLWQAAFDFAPVAKPDTRSALEDLQLKLSICRDEYDKTKNLALLLASTVYLHFNEYIHRNFTDADARLEDLGAFRQILGRYSSLETFLDEVGTDKLDVGHIISATGYEEGDFVSLASIHSAKGLEWRTVFFVGLVDGWIPDKRCLDEAGLEEERRLFHVAVTRARENLYLTAPQDVPGRWGDYSVHISRFVSELPGELFDPFAVPTQKAASPS